jgi:hypothetical protein
MGFIARRVAKRAEQYKSVDDYLKDLWRPLMAWVYAVAVMFDFVLAPILLGIYTIATGQKYIQWQPLTIQGGGMFHIAMGAVIGVSSYSHSQEKISGADGGATNGGSNFPSLPSSWDPATVKTGPLMPAYVPPPDDPAPAPVYAPAPAAAPYTPPAAAPAPAPAPAPVATAAPAPAAAKPPAEKSATGFPKAKRF